MKVLVLWNEMVQCCVPPRRDTCMGPASCVLGAEISCTDGIGSSQEVNPGLPSFMFKLEV